MQRTLALFCCLLLVFTLISCGKPDPELLQEEPPAERPVEPTPAPEPPPENVTYVKKPAFSAAVANEQAATLAADAVRTFALGSSLGQNFTLPNKTQQTVFKVLDIDHAPTQGPRLTLRVYASGIPQIDQKYQQFIYPTNWETWQWANRSIDRRTPIRAAANAAIAELFASEILTHSTVATDQYDGTLLSVAGAKHIEYVTFNGRSGRAYAELDEQGNAVKEEYNFLSQIRMLTAYSRLALAADSKFYASSFKKSDGMGYANQLFNEIIAERKRNPEIYQSLSSQALRETIESYVVFATITDALKWQILALSHTREAAGILQSRISDGGMVENAADRQLVAQAAAVTGLLYAYRATEDELYRAKAIEAWGGMKTLWDDDAGLFKPTAGATTYSYTASDLSEVFLALNAVNHVLEEKEQERFAKFFSNTIILSGILPAEYRDVAENIPSAADTLLAPVFHSRISYDPGAQRWTAAEEFDTAESMALAVALLQGAEDGHGEYRIADFGMPKPVDLSST